MRHRRRSLPTTIAAWLATWLVVLPAGVAHAEHVCTMQYPSTCPGHDVGGTEPDMPITDGEPPVSSEPTGVAPPPPISEPRKPGDVPGEPPLDEPAPDHRRGDGTAGDDVAATLIAPAPDTEVRGEAADLPASAMVGPTPGSQTRAPAVEPAAEAYEPWYVELLGALARLFD